MERNDRTSERFQPDIAIVVLAFVISCGLAALVGLTIAVF